MRDRNEGYVPDGLFLEGSVQMTEIGTGRNIPKGTTGVRRMPDGRWVKSARVAHGKADELNRDQTWWWADVSGDGSHWAHFRGHRVQIDVAFSTENEREVNGWKGRDEIRPAGTWTLALNRQQVWEGFIGGDPLASLRNIPQVIERLLDHGAINWFDQTPVADQLSGRKVYLDRTPAVVSSTSTLHQGCVMLRPAAGGQFPPAVCYLDDPEDAPDFGDRAEAKVDLLDPHVWWWRDKLIEGET